MSDLKADLKDIKGVGEATADSILEILSEHDAIDTTADDGYLRKAKQAAVNGNDRDARVYLQRHVRES